jgi:hypothetical protein
VSVVLAVLTLADVAFAFLFERQILMDPLADQFSAEGRDPRRSVALVGALCLLAPVLWAFLAGLLGLSVTQLAYYAGLSFVGVAFWGWRYRRVIWGTAQAVAGATTDGRSEGGLPDGPTGTGMTLGTPMQHNAEVILRREVAYLNSNRSYTIEIDGVACGAIAGCVPSPVEKPNGVTSC